MTRRFRIDGAEYDADALSPEGRTLVERLTFAHLQIQALSNQQALLTKAKNAYIADLKSDIVHGRADFDLAALFRDG